LPNRDWDRVRRQTRLERNPGGPDGEGARLDPVVEGPPRDVTGPSPRAVFRLGDSQLELLTVQQSKRLQTLAILVDQARQVKNKKQKASAYAYARKVGEPLIASLRRTRGKDAQAMVDRLGRSLRGPGSGSPMKSRAKTTKSGRPQRAGADLSKVCPKCHLELEAGDPNVRGKAHKQCP
jgi:hypothetical protein